MEVLVFEEEGASSTLKITLGDFLVFINWMNQTEKSLDRAEALPPLPDVDSGKVKGWVQLIQRLEERFRRSEEKKLALEANVIAQEAQLGQLLSHLHANIASPYDNLGQSHKAEEVRRRAEHSMEVTHRLPESHIVRVVRDEALYVEAREGAKREGLESLAGKLILGGMGTITPGPSVRPVSSGGKLSYTPGASPPNGQV